MTPQYLKVALFAAIAPVTLAAAPAAAQSVSYADPAFAIAKTQARTNAYQQISQTYASNIQSMQQKSTERQTVLQTIDTNGDNQVNDAELNAASPATLQQLQTIETEMNNLQAPIELARAYALQQIQAQYEAAQADVVRRNKINVILRPDAFVYAPEGANVTDKLTAALDARATQVQITPPADWRPNRATSALYSEVQEILQLDAYLTAMQQAQQQQQQGAAPAAPAPASEQR